MVFKQAAGVSLKPIFNAHWEQVNAPYAGYM
jgi:hypothetical protein